MQTPVLAASRAARPSGYVTFAAAAFLLAVASFWPTYFGPVLSGSALGPVQQSWVIPVHAGYFLGWIAAFGAQAFLVQTGNSRLHRRLGYWFAGYGAFGVGLGVFAVFAIALRRISLGGDPAEEAIYLFPGLMDMTMFAGFLGAGVALRNRRESHKRLMTMATCVLTIIGLGRLMPRIFPEAWLDPGLVATLVFALPVWIVMAVDVAVTRRFHPVYWAALPVFALKVNQGLIMDSPLWQRIGRGLLAPFL